MVCVCARTFYSAYMLICTEYMFDSGLKGVSRIVCNILRSVVNEWGEAHS